MTVKELKEKLAQHNDDDIIVIEEAYTDRDGWFATRKLYNAYITTEKSQASIRKER